MKHSPKQNLSVNTFPVKHSKSCMVLMRKTSLLLIFILLSTVGLWAQGVSINTTGNAADTSAMLDIESSTKGILIPRMTSAQRIAIQLPKEGLLVFDKNTTTFWFYKGSNWVELISNANDELVDADGDTKVEVEQNADEDIIRFTLGGTEVMSLKKAGIVQLNADVNDNIAVGDSSLTKNTTGFANTVIGYHSLMNNTIGAFNTAIGHNSLLQSTTGANNTAIGANTLERNTSGYNNTAIGVSALFKNTTGSENTAIGLSALNKNLTGYRNTAIGIQALNHNTGGYNNTAIGYGALNDNKSGSNNTAIGLSALRLNTNGISNVGVGGYSLFRNKTGVNNTAIGFQAGNNSTGDSSIFIGYRAGYNETGSNKLYISNSDADETEVLIYGEFDNDLLRVNGTLNIEGEYNFPTVDGTNGQVMQSDGSGNLAWVSPATTSTELQDADNDTKIEVEQNVDEDMIRFTLGGVEVMNLEKVGFLQLNADAKRNIAVGDNPIFGLTTGVRNAAFGHETLYNNDIGSENTGIGTYALYFNANGNGNSVLGYNAMSSSTSGNYNTAIGYEAGIGSDGDSNVFIGNRAGYGETGSQKLYIDNSTGDATEALIYGEFDNDLLRVNGTLNIEGEYNFPTVDGSNGQVMQSDGSGNLAWVSPLSSLTELKDADNDTKIEVEQNADEDIIRFTLEGAEAMRLEKAGILQLNADVNDNIAVGDSSLEKNTSGFANTVIGYHSLMNNTTGFFNTAIGYNSLLQNTTGGFNTAIGTKALERNTSGYNNTAIGVYGLIRNTTGAANTAIGLSALSQNLTGNANTAIGLEAMNDNTGGNDNTAIGGSALKQNTNGYRNVGVGGRSLYQNKTGVNNTAIGFQAGNNSVSGSRNVFIGITAGYFETGSDKLYINNSTGDATEALIYGEFDNDLLRVNGTLNIEGEYNFPTVDGSNGQVMQSDGSGNIAWVSPDTSSTELKDADSDTKIEVEQNADEDIIRFTLGGTEAMRLDQNGSLNIKGEYSFPTVDGSNGQVMQTDGTGNLAWVSPITTLTELKDADNDTKIEVEQNADEDIIRFTLDGTEAMSLEKAGIVQLNADASLNIAVGDSSLVNNSTGTRNTALGYESLLNNTTGSFNTAEGYNALKSNTIGAYNVANGNFALSFNTTGGNNTANGSFALSNNSTGAYNTANGSSSLSSNTTGGENSANGTFALNSNTTGSRNMASGSSALTNNTTGNNNTAIGYRAGFSSAVGHGNVFLGYSAGYNETGSNKLYISNSSTNNPLIYGDFSSNFLLIDGNLFVGKSGDGTVVTANAYNSYSDRRLKKNIVKIDGVIEKLESLNGYYYQWKDKSDTTLQIGVIAQEIEAVLPEIVVTDSLGFKSVDYSKLSAFLIEVVKKQQESIEQQKESDKAAREDLWKYVKNLEASVEAIKNETGTRNKIVQID